jgi:DNA-binding XRE family transcriptional regulator
MTHEELKAWRKWMGWSQRTAAQALGISRASVQLYELDSSREEALPVPKPVELACYALARGVRSYSGEAPSIPEALPRGGASIS